MPLFSGSVGLSLEIPERSERELPSALREKERDGGISRLDVASRSGGALSVGVKTRGSKGTNRACYLNN